MVEHPSPIMDCIGCILTGKAVWESSSVGRAQAGKSLDKPSKQKSLVRRFKSSLFHNARPDENRKDTSNQEVATLAEVLEEIYGYITSRH